MTNFHSDSEKKTPQQNSFVEYILLTLLKFSCNHERNGWFNKNVYSNLKNLKSFCGKKTLSTALGFEPRSFDCQISNSTN